MPVFFYKQNYKNILLFSIFILLPFIDAINGYLVIKGLIATSGTSSPSQLGRLMVSVLLAYLIIAKKLAAWPIFLFVYLFTVEVFSGLFHLNQYGFIYGVISAYKLGYLILLTMILIHYSKTTEGMLQLGKLVKYNLIIIATMLWFSTVTGIGNNTYWAGFGTISFFASGNGLGLYLGVGVLFLIGLRECKLVSISYKMLFFLIFSIILIGTKTALVLCMTNIIVMVLLSKYRISIIILCALLLTFYLPKIIEQFSIMFVIILKRFEGSDNIVMFLGSGRIQYVIDAYEIFLKNDPSIFRYLFGMGTFISFQNHLTVTEYDTLETDLFDLFFMYGLLSVLFFLSTIGFVLFQLRKYKILFLGMLLLSLHSIIAGHVLFNGMSSVGFALFICVSNYLSIQRDIDDKAIT
ncbi:hypothetical protein [Shewanella frigidimarina]|uniref:hypothetical protein n=1 Tax=Shewanella frigidimarina TaxID=56812 RepID=UPI003D7AE95C